MIVASHARSLAHISQLACLLVVTQNVRPTVTKRGEKKGGGMRVILCILSAAFALEETVPIGKLENYSKYHLNI